MMKDILMRLTSRKLWLAVAGVATGVSVALGVDASEIQSIAGCITALLSSVAYIVTEGKVDAERVKHE